MNLEEVLTQVRICDPDNPNDACPEYLNEETVAALAAVKVCDPTDPTDACPEYLGKGTVDALASVRACDMDDPNDVCPEYLGESTIDSLASVKVCDPTDPNHDCPQYLTDALGYLSNVDPNVQRFAVELAEVAIRHLVEDTQSRTLPMEELVETAATHYAGIADREDVRNMFKAYGIGVQPEQRTHAGAMIAHVVGTVAQAIQDVAGETPTPAYINAHRRQIAHAVVQKINRAA